jgi:hypothetical protein
LTQGELTKVPVPPGAAFEWAGYPVATSDILAHLLHEHQAGFVNRVLDATYRTRLGLHRGSGQLTAEELSELDAHAHQLTRYLLFADEVPLPAGGVEGDSAFKTDFLRDRHSAANGSSLKDFDLQTRLFKHRCSYMIYSPVVRGLPATMRDRLYRRLGAALRVEEPDPEFAYLPAKEKIAIRTILKETLPDVPTDW